MYASSTVNDPQSKSTSQQSLSNKHALCSDWVVRTQAQHYGTSKHSPNKFTAVGSKLLCVSCCGAGQQCITLRLIQCLVSIPHVLCGFLHFVFLCLLPVAAIACFFCLLLLLQVLLPHVPPPASVAAASAAVSDTLKCAIICFHQESQIQCVFVLLMQKAGDLQLFTCR